MSNTITETSFLDYTNEFLDKGFEAGMAAGREFFSIDRSYEVFTDKSGNESVQAKLKGRDEFITKALVTTLIAVAIITLLVVVTHGAIPLIFGHTGMLGPLGSLLSGIGNWVIIGIGLAILLNIKEIAIQSVARAREKQEAGITEETADTQYTLQELADEVDVDGSFRKQLDAFHEAMHRLTDTLFVPKAEASTDAHEIELQEIES